MKVLIDECLPRRLKFEIEADDVQTVPEADWAGKQNGELLRLAEAGFDVFVTNERNLEHQQNLKGFALALGILIAPTNDIIDLKPLMPAVNDVLKTITNGEIKYIRADMQ